MIDRGVIDLDAQISALGFHFVSDDAVRNTITVYDAGYEFYHRPGLGRFNWFGFYPLGEFIHHNQQVFFF